jgi:hypothetical protein
MPTLPAVLYYPKGDVESGGVQANAYQVLLLTKIDC